MKQKLFLLVFAFFISYANALAQQAAPQVKKGEAAPQKQEVTSKNEAAVVPAKAKPASQKEIPASPAQAQSFIPNENDVKSFVYRWFSWLDHQVDDFLLLYHLSKDDLLMQLPETTVKSQEDFQKWYQGIRNTIKANTHEITNLKVKGLGNGRFGVELTMRWHAQPYEGKPIDKTYKQTWELSLAATGRLTIHRYLVKK